MAAEKYTCPSCGSAVPEGAEVCDICGEDLHAARMRAQTTARPGEEASAVQSTPPMEHDEGKSIKKAPGRTPRRSGKAGSARQKQQSAGAAILFTTPQWIAISVSSFLLGAVLTATLLPTNQPAGDTVGTQQQGAQQQGAQQQGAQPQIDLERLESMRAYVENHPDDLTAQLRYANELHDANLLDQAIAQYKDYLEKDPANPDARVDLGICYFEKKQYDAAIREMERAVRDAPNHQLGHYNLGIVNLNAENLEAARTWFEKARDIDPTSVYGRDAEQILQQRFGTEN